MQKAVQKEEPAKHAGRGVLGTVLKAISIAISLVMLFLFLMFLVFFISLFSALSPSAVLSSGNVAVIPINGIIMADESSVGFGEDATSSTDVIAWIDQVEESSDIVATVFEINSPGGAPVATDEIAQAIKKMKKPNIAVIREVGASGAYWIATAADRIFVNRMSVTGSIGVVASYLEFAGLLERYNITYRRLVSGEYKDAGSPFKKMDEKEQEMYQELIDKIHRIFIGEVAANRNLSRQEVETVANGFIMLGADAVNAGLADYLGGKDDAVKYIEQKLNLTAEVFEFEKRKTILDIVGEMINKNSFFMGSGIGHSLLDSRHSQTAAVWT